MMLRLAKFYDYLDKLWHLRVTSKVISNILLSVFVFSLALVATSKLGWLKLPYKVDFFLAIDAAFTTLLLFEILELIFVLSRSVADSVGKQFEILSIILLRSAFKEFGHASPSLLNNEIDYMSLLPMLTDALGALIIFIIIGYYYKLQRHERITKNDKDQSQFITFKKVVAFFLLISFISISVFDIIHILSTKEFQFTFNNFYNLLIFTDILILLYSLRFQSQYTNLFRYSSFAFATILIRLSLSAPPYFNVAIGVVAGFFVLGLTYIYNIFRDRPEQFVPTDEVDN